MDLHFLLYFCWILKKYLLFSGKVRDMLLWQSRLGQFYQGFVQKALLLVNPTVLEIFYQGSVRKALLLVNQTVLEIFYQGFVQKALLLVNTTVLEMFYQGCCAK